jgi:hypothetical protein
MSTEQLFELQANVQQMNATLSLPLAKLTKKQGF